GHYRQGAHACKDLESGDDVGIGGLRVHVAKADRRCRLNAEEEQINETARPGVSDWIFAKCIEECEETIEDEKNGGRSGEEQRPGYFHCPVIEVTERRYTLVLGEGVPIGDVNGP